MKDIRYKVRWKKQKSSIVMWDDEKIFSQMFHGISEVCPNYVAIDLGDFDEEQNYMLYLMKPQKSVSIF